MSIRGTGRPRTAAFLSDRTITRVIKSHPTDTTINKTHATVRSGSAKSSVMSRAEVAPNTDIMERLSPGLAG